MVYSISIAHLFRPHQTPPRVLSLMRFCLLTHRSSFAGAHIKEHEDAFAVACWYMYTLCWWSLGVSFGLPHLHSIFSKGHTTGLQKHTKSRVSEYCTVSVRKERRLLRTWHLLCEEFDAWHCKHTIKWSTTKGRMDEFSAKVVGQRSHACVQLSLPVHGRRWVVVSRE